MADTVRLEPNPANRCFGCGGANAGGMKLTFEQDNVNRKIVGRFVLGERYQGGGGGLRTVESLHCCWMKPWAKFAAFAKFVP